jgi:hypothetical protein
MFLIPYAVVIFIIKENVTQFGYIHQSIIIKKGNLGRIKNSGTGKTGRQSSINCAGKRLQQPYL